MSGIKRRSGALRKARDLQQANTKLQKANGDLRDALSTLMGVLAFQERVGNWHTITFPNTTPKRIALRVLREAVELARAAGNTPKEVAQAVAFEQERFTPGADGIKEEAADVALALCALAERADEPFLVVEELARRLAYNQERDCTRSDKAFRAHRGACTQEGGES